MFLQLFFIIYFTKHIHANHQWTFNTQSELIDRQYLRIWKDSAPQFNDELHVMNVNEDDPIAPLPHPHHPSLQVYLPRSYNKQKHYKVFPVMIVLPGGGYSYLASHESQPPAEWLIQLDIVVFIQRYRLGPLYQYPTQLHDVQRAIRFIRYHSNEWNLNASQIGVLGFSAGGHLASLASNLFDFDTLGLKRDVIDYESARPDLQILIYPVIDFIHTYSPCSSLLGNDPYPSLPLLRSLSSQFLVTSFTPPAFLVHTLHDELVPIYNSKVYAQALKSHNVSFKFIKGDWAGHGFGLSRHWTRPCQQWLNKFWSLSPLRSLDDDDMSAFMK